MNEFICFFSLHFFNVFEHYFVYGFNGFFSSLFELFSLCICYCRLMSIVYCMLSWSVMHQT